MRPLSERPTMAEVIEHSALAHPTLFADTMLKAAKMHLLHSETANYKPGATVALGMASNLRRMADELMMNDFDAARLSFAETVQAFAVAATLQGLPQRLIAEVAQREDETRRTERLRGEVRT